jgi:hypothetical protein
MGRDMQQFRQRVIASYHLGPLDEAETRAYIEHRLTQVGWKGDPELELGAHKAIFDFAEGIPRRINLLCNRLLMAGFLNESHTLGAGDVETVAGEISDELGGVDRAEEPADARGPLTGHRGSLQAVRASPFAGEGYGDLEGHALARGESSTDASELTARVSRLEKAVTHVLEMLRRRPE